jgi:hypothetical protein
MIDPAPTGKAPWGPDKRLTSGTGAEDMFLIPEKYQGWKGDFRTAARRVMLAIPAALSGLLLTRVFGLDIQAVTDLAGLAKFGACFAPGAITYLLFDQRCEAIRKGAPLTPWYSNYGSIKMNAGRTFSPEYAAYQPLLDQAFIDQQGNRPAFLRRRHDRRDSRGRYTA